MMHRTNDTESGSLLLPITVIVCLVVLTVLVFARENSAQNTPPLPTASIAFRHYMDDFEDNMQECLRREWERSECVELIAGRGK